MLPAPTDRLAIYLNDHFAAATAGLELARRTAGSNRSNDYGRVLETLVDEITEDRETLRGVMGRLSVEPDRLKLAAAWAGEKVGRLKFNGQLRGYSPLSRLVELEGLSVGIEAKLALWQALRRRFSDDPRLRGVDLDALIERARSQRRRLERQRQRAAEDALT